jgi:hypothetical protein
MTSNDRHVEQDRRPSSHPLPVAPLAPKRLRRNAARVDGEDS